MIRKFIHLKMILILISIQILNAQSDRVITSNTFIERKIKSSKLSIPWAGIGTARLESNSLISSLKKGFTLIDTAKAYENEEMVGAVLSQIEDKNSIIVITKLFRPNLENKQILKEAVLDSIKKIGKIPDIFLIHGPYPDVHMVAMIKEIELLQKEGFVKDWGVSNFDIEHLEILIRNKLIPVINQIEYHPFFQRKELLHFCKKHNIIVQAYRPIAQGKVLEDDTIKKIATKCNISPANLVYSWLEQQDMAVVTKVASDEHQDEYAKSQKINLDTEDIQAITALNKGEMGRTCKKGGWLVPFTQEIKEIWETLVS